MSTDTAFARLGVPAPLSSALKAMRFTEPFEIQSLTIPDALAGEDILGRAPTGSGKTLSFGLPLLARISQANAGRPTGLILAPTRELAEQIRRELDPLAQSVHRTTLAVYGGKGLGQQLKALSKGVDLLVACPGRLLDLMNQGAVKLDDVEVAVVDEADRMADMGFLPDVRKILGMTPSDRQTMLYSATLDNDVQVLIDTYQTSPIEHAVAELEPDLSLLTHRFIEVPKKDRMWLAADIITDAGTTIVFVRTRHGVDRLARQLQRHGVKAAYIHGGRNQSQRDRALGLFTSGKVQTLVATDVAARGIHVDGVECVIHYDPPAEHKDYVHRSGRTARAGASGVVVSFLDRPQVAESKKMQRQLGVQAELEPVPDRMHYLKPVTSVQSPNRSKSKSKPRNKAKSAPGVDRSSKPGRNGQGRSRSGKPAASEENESSLEKLPSRRPPQRKSSSSRPKKRNGSKPAANANGAEASRAGQKSSQSGAEPSRAGQKSSKSGAKPSKGKSKRTGAAKPKSSRSGKPRPKNRKSKPSRSRRP